MIDRTALVPPGGPAGSPAIRHGGSIAGRNKLAGDDRLLDSEHRFAKGKHHGVEELTASSRRCSVGTEGQGAGLAARGSRLRPGRDPTRADTVARARFRRLGCERRASGLV
jgi:hypothetical protein